jgi:hypothetical protein
MDTTVIRETKQLQKTERTVVMDVQNITKSLPLGRERIEILIRAFLIYPCQTTSNTSLPIYSSHLSTPNPGRSAA